MSNLVNAIYNAPVISRDATEQSVIVMVKYNHKNYWGMAFCHDEDMEFFSRKVGYTIATARARMSIMEEELAKLKEEVKWKSRIYKEVTRDKPDQEFPELKTNLTNAEARYKALKYALKDAKADLTLYIKTQGKAIASVKRMRSMDKSN